MKKSTIQVVVEYEAATTAYLRQFFPLMSRLGFKYILPHQEVSLIHPNTIYFYAAPSSEQCSFPSKERTLTGVTIPVEMANVQKDFVWPAWPFEPPPQFGKLLFKSFKRPEKTIGIYNSSDNVLWLSDITHIGGELTRKPLSMILQVVQAYKELPEGTFLKWKAEWEKAQQFPNLLMGADPEFEVVDGNGMVIPANTVWPDSAYCDKKVGHDGDARAGEFRPDPQRTPLKLTNEFEKLIKEIAGDKAFPSGGSMYVGGGARLKIGGHIHVSGMDPTDELLDILGIYMAEPMYRSSAETSGRRTHHYGKWTKTGNRERCRWNGPDHWEYRPLMAYHYDKRTTNAVHCTFFCIIESWRRSPGILRHYYHKHYRRSSDLGPGQGPPCPDDYRRLLFYEKYKKHIEYFIKRFVEGKFPMERVDVFKNWLPNRKSQKRVQFTGLPSHIFEGFKVNPVLGKLIAMLEAVKWPEVTVRINLRMSSSLDEEKVDSEVAKQREIIYAGLTNKAAEEMKRLAGECKAVAYVDDTLLCDEWKMQAYNVAFGLPTDLVTKARDRTKLLSILKRVISTHLKFMRPRKAKTITAEVPSL